MNQHFVDTVFTEVSGRVFGSYFVLASFLRLHFDSAACDRHIYRTEALVSDQRLQILNGNLRLLISSTAPWI